MTCIAMGHPDDSLPAIAVESKREQVGNVPNFVGYHD